MEAWRPGRPVAEIARDTTAVFEKHGARGLLQGSFLGACGRTSLTQRPDVGAGHDHLSRMDHGRSAGKFLVREKFPGYRGLP